MKVIIKTDGIYKQRCQDSRPSIWGRGVQDCTPNTIGRFRVAPKSNTNVALERPVVVLRLNLIQPTVVPFDLGENGVTIDRGVRKSVVGCGINLIPAGVSMCCDRLV